MAMVLEKYTAETPESAISPNQAMLIVLKYGSFCAGPLFANHSWRGEVSVRSQSVYLSGRSLSLAALA
jgi:hypothetical protein